MNMPPAARIANAIISAAIVVLFLIHGISGSFQMLALGPAISRVLAYVMLALVTVGILYVIGADDLMVKRFLLIETGMVYLLYLLRRTQILSTSCKPLTTFLYLCGLELLPAALLVGSAVIPAG